MPTSEKQKAYVKKHQQEKLDEIKIRPPQGTKALWRAAADAAGISMQRFIIDAVNAAAGLTEEEWKDRRRADHE